MHHFDITRWTDYVHGVAAPLEREAMSAHLAGGCASCTSLVALIGRVHQEAAQEAGVPEHLVRAAKLVFPARRAAESPGWLSLPRLAAQLIFNSIADATPEGARAGSEAAVQMIYHAGDYAIELQLESDAESTSVALVGQVVNRAADDAPLGHVPVLLMAGKRQMASGQSNRFGEFCLLSRAHPALRLCMPIESIEKRVEIPLTKVMAGLQ